MDGGRYGLIPGDKDTGEVRSLCNAVDPDADLAALRSTADAAVRTSTALAARQADAFEQVFTELLASPEITKCVGAMGSICCGGGGCSGRRLHTT